MTANFCKHNLSISDLRCILIVYVKSVLFSLDTYFSKHFVFAVLIFVLLATVYRALLFSEFAEERSYVKYERHKESWSIIINIIQSLKVS